MKTYHVTKTEDGWQGKAEGGSRASATGATKQEVTQRTIEIAKNQPEPISVRIHKMDGKIQEERTYPGSADPSSSKG
ncbi:MAG: DUF2188 domain-containing protein [Moraxellaceae bacterium]|nr:DUF2188 domain-containing protein [Pseudobdellovibrionaceae bacterium]